MLKQRTTEGIGWFHGDCTICVDCSIAPPNGLWLPHTSETIANREDECVMCKRIFRDWAWIARVEKDGRDKGDNLVSLHIDPTSKNLCTITVQALGGSVHFVTEKPAKAIALFEALLQVTDISAD